MKNKFLIAILTTVIAGGTIFYACKKDNNGSVKTHKSSFDVPSWKQVTDFDLEQFVTSDDFKMGEFHNAYLDFLPTTDIFPNQTAYNQYDLIYEMLPPEMRRKLDEADANETAFGDIVSRVFELQGSADFAASVQDRYPNIVPYLEQMQQHFDNDMPNLFLEGNINESLNFLLRLRHRAMSELANEEERYVMSATLEIAAYSSVYWYDVLWTEDYSPWHRYLIEDGDEPLPETGPFWDKVRNAFRVVAKICATIATDAVTAVAVGSFCPPAAGPAAAVASGAILAVM